MSHFQNLFLQTGTGTNISECVIDASIVVKWFAEEQDSASAQSILRAITGGEILVHAPDLLVYEVSNALWKGKKLGKGILIDDMEVLLESGIKLQNLNLSIGRSAVNFMTLYNLTFYDSVYAALAYTMGIPLLTSDAKGHKKIKEIEILELSGK